MAAQWGSLPGVGLLCRERFSSWGEKAPSPQLPLSTLGLLIPSRRPLPWTSGPPPSLLHLAGLHPLFGAFPPVAAIQAVEAAGPDGAAAGGLGHGEGLGEGTLSHQGPWQKADPSLPPSASEELEGGAEAWAAAQQRRVMGLPEVPDWMRTGAKGG